MSEQDKKDMTADEKAKAAAASKAKAAAAAKAKAAAAAKAKLYAEQKKSQAEDNIETEGGQDRPEPNLYPDVNKQVSEKNTAANLETNVDEAVDKVQDGTEEKAKAKAKAIAIAKAKAAAAAKAKKAKGAEDGEAEEAPKKPSVNQPYLDKYVKVITDNIGSDVIEDSYINQLGKDVPTLLIKQERWYEVAQFLKHNEQLAFDFLSNLHGTDFETHMETYYHFYSYKEKQSLAIRVKIERDNPQVASVTPIWAGADWPERESYDLLGITYEGHPNLTRIMLSDDWVGYPLRKDYEQHDEEV